MANLDSDAPCALYRYFDHKGKLLYVGISLTHVSRQQQHAVQSQWYRKARTQTIEWFANRRQAARAEKRAIQEERPEWNVTYNTRQDDQACINAAIEARHRHREVLLSEIAVSLRISVYGSLDSGVALVWSWRHWQGESVPEGTNWRNSRLYQSAMDCAYRWALASPYVALGLAGLREEPLITGTHWSTRELPMHGYLTHQRVDALDTYDWWHWDLERMVPDWAEIIEETK